MKKINFNSIEKYFFLMIIGLNLIPILLGKFFPTLDGAAHLHNSQLIQSLLFNNNESLDNFFVFINEPVPNWTGHIILSFFNIFLPAFMAEKVLLLFYLIGLPLSFRAFIKTISPNNKSFSYFIFPFTYSFTFFLGFYNFSIALIFILLTLDFWVRNNDNISSWKNLIKLFLLITMTYFSHIFVFAILLFLIGLHIFFKALIQIINNSNQLKDILIYSFRKFGLLLFSSMIPLLLFLFSFYFYTRSSSGNKFFINHTELVDWLKNIRPIIAFNFTIEEDYTKKIFYLLFSITIIVIYNRINKVLSECDFSNKKKWASIIKNSIKISDVWLFASIIILFLYFKLPNSDGNAGFVSVRLGLLFFLFLIIWLSTYNPPKWFGFLIITIILYCNFKLNSYYFSVTKDLNKVAIECNNASEYIVPNSIVLPINYSDNCLHRHFSNYLGIDKPMIILENYECGTGYFPLKWNEKSMPNLLFGDRNLNQYSCLQFNSYTKNPSKEVDYVFILKNRSLKLDSCNQRIEQVLFKNYIQIYNSKSCILYKRKNMR